MQVPFVRSAIQVTLGGAIVAAVGRHHTEFIASSRSLTRSSGAAERRGVIDDLGAARRSLIDSRQTRKEPHTLKCGVSKKMFSGSCLISSCFSLFLTLTISMLWSFAQAREELAAHPPGRCSEGGGPPRRRGGRGRGGGRSLRRPLSGKRIGSSARGLRPMTQVWLSRGPRRRAAFRATEPYLNPYRPVSARLWGTFAPHFCPALVEAFRSFSPTR